MKTKNKDTRHVRLYAAAFIHVLIAWSCQTKSYKHLFQHLSLFPLLHVDLLNAQRLRAPGHDVDPVRLTKASLPSSHLGSPVAHAKGAGKRWCARSSWNSCCVYMYMDVHMYRCIPAYNNMHRMYVYIHIIESIIFQNQKIFHQNLQAPSLPNAEVGEVKRLPGRSLEDWVLQPWHLIQTPKKSRR